MFGFNQINIVQINSPSGFTPETGTGFIVSFIKEKLIKIFIKTGK